MPKFCAKCGFKITAEVKVFRGMDFDNRCHRAEITSEFNAVSAYIGYVVGRYFKVTGEDRARYRAMFRELLAEYKELSY